MANPGVSDDEKAEALAAYERNGGNKSAAARELGLDRMTFKNRLKRAQDDPAVEAAKAAANTRLTPTEFWVKVPAKDGEPGYSVRVRPNDDGAEIEAAVDRICERIAARSPAYAKRPKPSGDHLLVISPADVHFGKLAVAMQSGDEYNISIAEERTKEGVAALIAATVGAYGDLEAITVNTGNDSLHVDNMRGTTTGGTPQDVAGSIFQMFDAAFWTWVWVIEQAAQVAPVFVVFDPSNHPFVSDWMLNRALMAHFHTHPRVTFNLQMQSIRHRKYQVYGVSLIGYAHGDGADEKKLPALMQHECRKWWGMTQRGYWIIKHKHHKSNKAKGLDPFDKEKDHIGVTVIRTDDVDHGKNVPVEIVRSPSGTDLWHDIHGHTGAIKAVEAYVFDARRGNVARFTHPFTERAA